MRFETLADWLAWQETLHPLPIDLGLARISRVLGGMGLPSRRPFTFSVGGTNGKGSCVALLDSILRAAGYRVGTYTSPHILRYNERISLDGRPVDDDQIIRTFELIDRVREGTTLSFFEFGTLAALDIFAREGVDIQLLEVGLGGRLDAVNVVDADIALIATIDIDHREWLGDTRELVGAEKAGILRGGHPAVVADNDVPDSVVRVARELGAELHLQGRDFGFERADSEWNWWSGHDSRLDGLPVPAIPGEHQFINASAVLQCLQCAASHVPVSREAIERGLLEVRLPGRFQFFPRPVPVLLDVAHNPQAVRNLVSHLHRHYPNHRCKAVFSVMRDKDILAMVDILREHMHEWYLAPLRMPRAASSEELKKILHNAGITRIRNGFTDASDAIHAASREALPGDLLVIFGSFFLVSEYLAMVADEGD